jgi:hypothetical protein
VVYRPAAMSQFVRHSSVPVIAPLQRNLLYCIAQLHFFFAGILGLPFTVVTRAANPGEPAHPLYRETALQRAYSSDLLVDADPEILPFFRCRFSIFCKAPLKKSISWLWRATNDSKIWIFFLSFSSIGLETGARPFLGFDTGGEGSADGGEQPINSFFHL